jgi:hypothetical protein
VKSESTLITAGDPDLNDLYLCEIVRPADHLTPNPLVRVLRILRYPIQHAIMHPEDPNENVPIPAGTVCRLQEASGNRQEALEKLLSLTYAESLRKSAEEYMAHAPPDEQEIVRRHLRGEYRKKRIVISK